MANLENLLKFKVEQFDNLLESEGKKFLLEDTSKNAGFRFTYTKYLVAQAIYSGQRDDISDAEKSSLYEKASGYANEYTSTNIFVPMFLPWNFLPDGIKEYENFHICPENDFNIARNNVYHVLMNLNEYAREIVSGFPPNLLPYYLRFQNLYGSLIREENSPENLIGLIKSLDKTFDFVNKTFKSKIINFQFRSTDNTSLWISRIFKNYQGPKSENYGLDVEGVEQFCMNKERIILNKGDGLSILPALQSIKDFICKF
ncbi:MAG: hypothetical protein ACOYT4_04050 [Nanoarchaeota archaeon]